MAIAMVSGASGGIGSALCEKLVKESRFERVYGIGRHSRGSARLQRIAASHPALILVDVNSNDDEAMAEFAQSLRDQKLDLTLLINANGLLHADEMQPEKALGQCRPSAMYAAIEANTLPLLQLAKHLVPLMPRSAHCVFASLSARVGSIEDNRLGGWYSYRASKAAHNMLVKNLSIELPRKKTSLVCVAYHPGTVDTDLSAPFQANVPAEKLFSREHAAELCLSVLDDLKAEDNGGFFAWDGSRIPW